MGYTIYFHDDLDGTASSAVLLFAFKKLGKNIKEFVPIEYDDKLKAEWSGREFPEPFGILDFLYHPKADLWIDHHLDPFVYENWKTGFQNNDYMQWESSFPSCCGLTVKHFQEHFRISFPQHLIDLANEVNIVDGGLYTSPEDVLDIVKPVRQLAKVLGVYKFDRLEFQKFLINNLTTLSAEEIVRLPDVQEKVGLAKIRENKIIEYYKKFIKLNGNTTFIDITDPELKRSHYTAYYLYPESIYSVGIAKEEIEGKISYHIGVGCNFWKKDLAKINIGELMKKYGGGGHRGIGAAEVKNYNEAIKIANEIIEYLNKNG